MRILLETLLYFFEIIPHLSDPLLNLAYILLDFGQFGQLI